jgi:hypothetical protein
MVLFTNNRKIGGFYNPRLFDTELRMTDQVKYLGVMCDDLNGEVVSNADC